MTGATGAAGRTILSGASNPTSGTGANGDFYINTATDTLFGPKASGVWPAGESLVGPTGSTGAAGPSDIIQKSMSNQGVNTFELGTVTAPAGAWLLIAVFRVNGSCASGTVNAATGKIRRDSTGTDLATFAVTGNAGSGCSTVVVPVFTTLNSGVDTTLNLAVTETGWSDTVPNDADVTFTAIKTGSLTRLI